MPTYGKQTGSGGGGSGSVVTDSTLTGSGTGGSPLGINPVAARAPDWRGYCANLFQQKSGVSPVDWKVGYEDTIAYVIGGGSSPELRAHGFSAVGGTATVARSVAYPGSILLTGPSTGTPGSVYAIWSQDDTSSNSFFPNPRTRRWAVFYRLCVTTAPNGNSQCSFGMRSGTSYFGVGYVGAQANWQYVRGVAGSQTNITSLATAIDSTGTKFITAYVGNFDLANVVANVDARAGIADVVCEAVSAIPTSPTSGQFLIDGTGSDAIALHDILICSELPLAGA